jgi:hypothetical protein
LAANQDKQGAGWRFLQSLEKGIGRLGSQIVGIIDDGDLSVATSRLQREVFNEFANQVDRQVDLVRGTRCEKEIGMGSGIRQGTTRTSSTRNEFAGLPLAQDCPGEFPSECVLADARRPNEEIRMAKPAFLPGRIE